MLDTFDPNLTYQEISAVFGELKPKLIELIGKIKGTNEDIDTQGLKQPISIDKQRLLGKDILNLVKFDLDSGRLDETEHPFTTGYLSDVRLTTKYFENDFTNSLFSTLHESGHGLYEQNLPKEFMYQPISEAISSSVHESQSRFVENIIGRSYSFWKFYFPKLKKILGSEFKMELDDFYKAINKVEFSKIRIEADEVTYCLHIILRFEIERDLMDGKIDFEELPQIWNQKIKDYFGLEIENDAEGVLQDVHWSSGLLGYFPSYALGNILSGQLLNTMKKELNFDELLRNGEISKIISWLTTNVHKQGGRYGLNQLCEKVTGEKLNSKYYLEYLTNKYKEIYKF
jgi:carboxypeptidase Taq